MSVNHHAREGAESGFSLIEVLVALAIATLLITLIAPMSRHSLRTITSIESDLDLYRHIDLQRDHIESGGAPLSSSSDIKQIFRVSRLPLFSYEPTAPQKWQPVLVSIGAEREGHRIMIEVIKLERERE